ncbi:MAG TPA: hypothetical protein VIM37_03415 [Candidatus Microsaccharimonas sp.]|jgi:quinol-cytochrome oxidoreductase complex cytochrome b subunit
MSVELQTTMAGVGIIVGTLIVSVCIAGAPLATIPLFGMGISAAIGALFGELFHGSATGAIIGALVGVALMCAWWVRKDNKEQAERLRRRGARPH